jgi:hypothetical protein
MKVTIIPDDSYVAVDGNNTHQPLNLSSCNIPAEVHALQWFETKGWIEFDDPVDPFAPKPNNEEIITLPEWALACIAVWEAWTPPAPKLVPPTNEQPATTQTQTA